MASIMIGGWVGKAKVYSNDSVATVWDLRSLTDEMQRLGEYDVRLESHVDVAI
jgi:hypothetical protein